MSRRVTSSGYGQTQTRKQQLVERFGKDIVDKRGVDAFLTPGDTRMYMYYAGVDDLTQAEAYERANTLTDMSQSTVSRVIREMDDRILTEPVHGLDEFMEKRQVDRLERLDPEFMQEYRQAWIRAWLDIEALGLIRQPEKRPPQWAKDRFPDLDHDLGRRFGEADPHYSDDRIYIDDD